MNLAEKMKRTRRNAEQDKVDTLARPLPDPDGPRDWVDGPPPRPPVNGKQPTEQVAPPERRTASEQVAPPKQVAPPPEPLLTEHLAPEPPAMSEQPAPAERAPAEAEAELSPIEAARARLRARGLLADGPTAPIPGGRRPARPVLMDDVLAEPDTGSQRAAPGDEWDVVSASNTLVPIACPQCRVDQQVPGDVTRFRCRTCDRAWRWAICESCDEVGFPLELQETWRCTACNHYTRSWWRTPTAAREALEVVARRRDLAARTERREATAARRRRFRVVAIAVVLAAVIAGGALVAATSGTSGPVTGTAETCRQFDKLRADLGSGTLDGTELAASLRALQAASAGADPAVASATAELVSVGRPSKAAFLVAQTELADACTAATH